MQETSSPSETGPRRSILIIEDDEELLSVLRFVLRNYGEIHVAASASEARSVLRNVSPDLIISDVGLGDGNGVEFVDALPGVPVILISGIPRVEEDLKGTGVYEFVPKPVAPERIRELVGAALTSIIHREARAEVAQAIQRCEKLSKELNDTITRLKKLHRLFALTGFFAAGLLGLAAGSGLS